MELTQINQLEFGDPDAATYIFGEGKDGAEFFRRSFYESKHLKRALDRNVYFLIGEKGTGKTAYSVYASKFLKPNFIADVSFFQSDDFTRFVEVASSLDLTKAQYSSL